MDILERITAYKRIEVELRKRLRSVDQLAQGGASARARVSMRDSLRGKRFGIIAEFKRKSPSKGFIHQHAKVADIVPGYAQAGAAGISVLTDAHFFGGGFADLEEARALVDAPLLQKDFVVDEYQLHEAKWLGADVVLLIAAALSVAEAHALARKAKELGMEVLLELHDDGELDHVNPWVDMVGINNRNLKTFAVDIEASLRLAERIPSDFLKVSESGLSSPDTIRQLRRHGFGGFLMGESFMREARPAEALEALLAALGDEE